ncbi:MAG: flagellin [Planctomycetota bacterium]|nr:flagellin [Planctomycetota bacterium]
MRLNTNVPSLIVQTNLYKHTQDVNGHLSRLSSGLRIESAADDPAGLGMAENMRSKARSLESATRAIENGQSMAGMTASISDEAIDLLTQMRALALTATDETLNDDDRATLSAEFVAKYDDIARLAQSEYNDLAIADGNFYSVLTGTDPTEEIEWASPDLDSATITVLEPFDLSNPVTAKNLIPFIDNAVDVLQASRANVGGALARMDFTHSSLLREREQTVAAESKIRDADVAFETAGYTRAAVLQAGAVAMLAQANSRPELALRLLDSLG